MGYKKLEVFLEQGINLRANSFLKRDPNFLESWAAHSHPKNTRVAPNNVELGSMHEAKVNITKGVSLRKHQQFQTLEVIFSKK